MQKTGNYITEEKKKSLLEELEDLRGPKRKEILTALEYAKSLGDLSENAEYHQAREDQGKLEERIKKIEQILRDSEVVSGGGGDIVEIGSKVIVQKDGTKDKKIFQIVGSEEADMVQNKISNRSPFGEALFGKKKGDTISFKTPSGEVNYKIIDVSYNKMSSIDEIRDSRIKKLELLKTRGINPYPSESKRELSLKEAIDSFPDLEKDENPKWITGRIMSIRGQGAIVFLTLNDGTALFQALLKKDLLGDEKFNLFTETVDIGDFVEVQGIFFTTKRGEKTVEAKDWRMLSKSLRPLPEKWHGLQDVEERFRKRYLEILTDREVYDRFVMRTKVIKEIKKFFDDLGFLEIETPILKNNAGGAMAEPFLTHHNDLGIDMKLRISLEIEHKMLMAGGFPAVYEIGKNFRNEGSDPTHMQEFTMMEWYSAYHTLEENIVWTENLLKHLAKDIIGKNKFIVYDKDGKGVEVDFDTNWPREKFGDLLKKNTNIDMASIDIPSLQNEALKYGIEKSEFNKIGRANLLDFIFKHAVRPNLVNPVFVIDYPGELKPLANQNDDGTAKVAQLIIGGAEITNQYSELIDPIKQRELLEAQAKAKDAGDKEAMEFDEDFIMALEYGVPQMTGFGMGIDRLLAIFFEQKNLRETIFFPIMKPKNNE